MANASITGGPREFFFRLDPNSITWRYVLNTSTQATHGGKVVQLLGVSIQSFTVQVDSGSGGLEYLRSVLLFAKDLILWHSKTKSSVMFNYPTRGYRFKVQLDSMTMRESVDNVAFPFTLTFSVDEDIDGVVASGIMASELAKIQQGIGYRKTKYNTPVGELEDVTPKPIQAGPGKQLPF